MFLKKPGILVQKKLSTTSSPENPEKAINLCKEELKELTWREDNSDVSKLETSNVGKVRSLNKYNAYRESDGDFPSDPRDLLWNTITIDYW